LQEPIETSDNTPIEVTILEEVMGLRLLMVNLFWHFHGDLGDKSHSRMAR